MSPRGPRNNAVPGCPKVALREEELGRDSATSPQAGSGQLEDADFIGRTEAVFHRAQDAELMRAFAFEGQHGIDHMFDDTGAGDLSVFGDVADEDDGGAGSSWRTG